MSARPVSSPGRDRSTDVPSARAVLRVVTIVVSSALALYLLYLIRVQLGYLVLAAFLAVCASAPINVLSRHMRRGAAVALVYLGIVLTPVIIGAILVPPVVRQSVTLAHRLPAYVTQLQQTMHENAQLRRLDENFDLTQRLSTLADDLISGLGRAAGALAGAGAGLIGSLFAIVTVVVLSLFMVRSGRMWTEAVLARRPAHEAEATRRAIDAMAGAVSGYVAGALAQATLAGIVSYVMLWILGVPGRLPLAVLIALLDLIPLVGATLGAVVVGVVTLFVHFPTVTVAWIVFAVVYQQVENYVIQPRIQSRAVELDPFVVVLAAIIGGALLGILGALLAIPTAAVLQIGIREYLGFRAAWASGEGAGAA